LTKINHEYTHNIVCPYCGYEDRDSWETHMEDGDLETVECGRCEKEFEAECHVTVEYVTYKLGEKY
jgi:transcription elongation factor Elf1